jgi:hypothetical protein
MHNLKSIALKKRRNLDTISMATDAEILNATSTGWVGARIPNEEETFTLEQVMRAPYNLCHVKWDGRCVFRMRF